MRYEFDDERNRSTPAVRPKGRSAKPPSGLLDMSFYAPSVYRMPMAAPTDCSRRVAYLRPPRGVPIPRALRASARFLHSRTKMRQVEARIADLRYCIIEDW